RDGGNDNRSWNCGAEGATTDTSVNALRARQTRNAAALLLLSRGPKLWLWGDEILRTQHGNNNPWCQDGPEWWLDWEGAGRDPEFTRLVRGLIALRRAAASLRSGTWAPVAAASGGPALAGRRLVARVKRGRAAEFVLLVNGEAGDSEFPLPAPGRGRRWHGVV